MGEDTQAGWFSCNMECWAVRSEKRAGRRTQHLAQARRATQTIGMESVTGVSGIWEPSREVASAEVVRARLLRLETPD